MTVTVKATEVNVKSPNYQLYQRDSDGYWHKQQWILPVLLDLHPRFAQDRKSHLVYKALWCEQESRMINHLYIEGKYWLAVKDIETIKIIAKSRYTQSKLLLPLVAIINEMDTYIPPNIRLINPISKLFTTNQRFTSDELPTWVEQSQNLMLM